MNRTTLLIVLVALVGAVAGLLIGQRMLPPRVVPVATMPAPTAPAPAQVPAAASELPPIELPQIDGRKRALTEWRGRPLLINYWATWCPPCLREMPLLDDFAARQGDRGVAVVGIAIDDPAAVREFLERVPVGYPTLLEAPGPEDSSMRLGNNQSVLPFSVLADAQGRILATHAGSFEDDTLKAWLDEHLEPGTVVEKP